MTCEVLGGRGWGGKSGIIDLCRLTHNNQNTYLLFRRTN